MDKLKLKFYTAVRDIALNVVDWAIPKIEKYTRRVVK